MPLDFSDLIPSKAPISFDDLIPKQAAPSSSEASTQGAGPPIEPDASQRIAAAGVQGAVEGFGHPMGQTILSDEAQDWMDAKQREGGVGGFLAGLGSTAAEDIGTGLGVVGGVGNAVFRGAQGAVAQTGAELGAPQLGRDVAAIPEAFMGSPGMLARAPELGVLPTDRPYIPRSVAEGNLLLDFPRSPDVSVTARQIQARDGVGIMEAWNRAHAENNAAAIAKIGQATDIDGAIAAAGKAAEAPSGAAPDTLAETTNAPVAQPGATPPPPPGMSRAEYQEWAEQQQRDYISQDRARYQKMAADMAAGVVPPVEIGLSPRMRTQPGYPEQRLKELDQMEANPTPTDPAVIDFAYENYQARNGAPSPQSGGPQSAGAAASRDLALPGSWELTPKQIAAYRGTAEGKKLLESQEPGVADYNEYVRGVIANTAEQEQTVNTARELKSLNITAPEVGQEARDLRFANNEKRISHLSDTIKSPVDVANAVEDLRLQDDTQLAGVWQNKEDADAQPMLDAAARITTSPDGRRPLVRRVVSSVLKELYDENGELLTDPEQLYGVRKHIDDLMDEQDAGGGKKNARAMSALIKLKDTLDTEVIEPAADGFGQYLSDHAEAAQKIDEMKVLQSHESKLFDAQNYLTYNRFQTMMRQIVDSRQARGLNDYKSITPETMARLWALRDDLRRSASAIELARTTGSDTAQNLWDMVKGAAAGHIGTAAATGVGALIGGPIGAGIGGTLKLVGGALASGRTARIQTARGMEMLNPPRTLTPPSPD